MIGLAVPTVAAGLLLDRRRLLTVVLVLAAALVIGAASQGGSTDSNQIVMADEVAFDLSIIVAVLSTLLIFLTIFAGNTNQIAAESLLHIQQRQWVVELGVELGKTTLAESVILARALTIIHDRFAYSFAQIYVFDEDENVLKRTMNTGLGQQDLQERGNLSLTETNAISEAARTRQIVTVAVGDLGSGYLRSSSRYGIAVPILHNQNLIGVLDIQTANEDLHSFTELETLRLFAGQLGAGLMNGRRVQELDRSVKEQAAINARLQTQLTEFQRREQLRVSTVWAGYLEGRGKTAIGFDLLTEEGLTPVAANDLPDDVRMTLEEGKLHIETRGNEKNIHVPIRFRNQMLGAMVFSLPATQDLTNRQIEMTQVVSERLAVALENMRLFEQSQAQAVRERKAGQIASQLIEAKDVTALLNLAAESFNEVLGAVRTEIYLQPDFLAEPLYVPHGEEANQ
jgi:GAF domain-containing protein